MGVCITSFSIEKNYLSRPEETNVVLSREKHWQVITCALKIMYHDDCLSLLPSAMVMR